MMKKFLALCLVLFMLICLTACGSNNPTSTSNNEKTQTSEIVSEDKTTTEETTELSKFEQFEKGLKDNGLQFEITEKMASMVGAKEGYGYLFTDETSVELYLFDTSSDAYKEAKKSNKLNLVDFGITMDVVFNKDICIYFNGESTNKTQIQNIFNGIK